MMRQKAFPNKETLELAEDNYYSAKCSSAENGLIARFYYAHTYYEKKIIKNHTII